MTEALVVPPSQLIGLHGKPIGAAVPRQPHWLDEEQGVKDQTLIDLGDLDDIELFYNDVLVIKYVRENVGAGLIAAPETQMEDRWQGVVGMVLKVGPRAFVDDEKNQFYGITVKPGDWVLYRYNDGWDKHVLTTTWPPQAAECRVIQDAHIRGRVKYPGRLL